MEPDRLVVKGASEHNLKSVYLEVPKKKLVVFTGVSGSGKSSMAFDTIYAEGQRRYVESLSSYARQFLGQLEKPKYDWIKGLSPTIAIEQKAASKNPRSTVGTITEVYDYLRVLFAKIGVQHCHRCGRPVTVQTPDQIVQEIMRLPDGSRFTLLAPLVVNKKGEHREVLEEARAAGFTRARIDGVPVRLDEEIKLEKNKKHTVELIVDRLVFRPDIAARLAESVETALKFGDGLLTIAHEGGKEVTVSENLACTGCGISFPQLSHQSFSFNSPLGMCKGCNGLGNTLEMDPALIVPDSTLSVREGAINVWGERVDDSASYSGQILENLAREYGIDLDLAWQELPEKHRKLILYGTRGKSITVHYESSRGTGEFVMNYAGVANNLLRRFKETRSEDARDYYSRFLRKAPCPECGGSRLRAESAAVKVGGVTIVEICRMAIAHTIEFFAGLKLEGNQKIIAGEVLKEVRSRLAFLHDVGLSYLTLDRAGPSLSGGEAQRIRLASQIGSELTGVLYILDEPSIGLHQKDNVKLLKSLQHLRDIGNTVIVVEHDQETMEQSDWIIDFGPGAGAHGGEIVASGTPTAVKDNPASLTGRYLAGVEQIEIPATRRCPSGWLSVLGAAENNLKGVDVHIPLGAFVAVTGVSGAGKSSLIRGILYPALARALAGAQETPGKHGGIKGMEALDKVIHIDQGPIGRTPRSNPATYSKAYDPIRELFASIKESKMHGYTAARFSFNLKGGRCEACEGDGVVRVEMHFLADVYVPCEVCRGRRFNDATLRVKYKGRSIADVLDLSIQEAHDLFENIPRIKRILKTLMDVGLGYMKLGQQSPTLSGGEAQRVKLARELSKTSTGRTFYILDEPTTGLHFDDIRRLIEVLIRLVEGGNTVLVIEHNLDVIKNADHCIDLGPEGGEGGGRVVAAGSPEEIARVDTSHTGQFLKRILTPGSTRRTARVQRSTPGAHAHP
ncbi:MAG: excinuclease ABC subunit UvrA [Candidatus Riflebacteria bacterium]|nr:excinuclease ABC subunit UvrA [Candidatus Riflebacteria bacterium]